MQHHIRMSRTDQLEHKSLEIIQNLVPHKSAAEIEISTQLFAVHADLLSTLIYPRIPRFIPIYIIFYLCGVPPTVGCTIYRSFLIRMLPRSCLHEEFRKHTLAICESLKCCDLYFKNHYYHFSLVSNPQIPICLLEFCFLNRLQILHNGLYPRKTEIKYVLDEDLPSVDESVLSWFRVRRVRSTNISISNSIWLHLKKSFFF